MDWRLVGKLLGTNCATIVYIYVPIYRGGGTIFTEGGPILKKPFFGDFSKNLLNKSQILGVPPPLPIYKPAHIPDSWFLCQKVQWRQSKSPPWY